MWTGINLSSGDYDFLLSWRDFKRLGYSALEAELSDSESKSSLGKKVRLSIGNPRHGEVDMLVVPGGVCWEKLTEISFVIERGVYSWLKKCGHSYRGNLACGNLYIHVSNEDEVTEI